MSAFMVADTTINRIVSFLELKLLHDWPFLAEKFRRAGFEVHSEKFCSELGRAMFQLNVRGVNARYGEGEAQEFRNLDYRYKPEFVDVMQVYKSLNCWLYQCMEGDVPKDPFYKLMREVEATVAEFIVSRLPEYDCAEWG
jgi:hypothetical protein